MYKKIDIFILTIFGLNYTISIDIKLNNYDLWLYQSKHRQTNGRKSAL
ncbi:hypothetical protein EZS27_035588 [termite gut metagenome]|uniref:Uncharacterized protein n=1 Tax=termite gut metagenome TaxID=433724 RepID=A0A5J4PW31_9ZZZZ